MSGCCEVELTGLPEGEETWDAIIDFKLNLISSVVTRFTTHSDRARSRVPSLSSDDEVRNTVTVDVFQSEKYILATVLDPRVKMTPFKGERLLIILIIANFQLHKQSGLLGMDHYPEVMKVKVPDEKAVEKLVKDRISQLSRGSGDKETDSIIEESDEPATKKSKYGSMFNLVTKINSKGAPPEHPSEMEQYMALPVEGHKSDPLDFWKRNKKRFPKFSALAVQHLAFPATSGSVERLFSVAGAIGRVRRSRISATLMEKTLTVR